MKDRISAKKLTLHRQFLILEKNKGKESLIIIDCADIVILILFVMLSIFNIILLLVIGQEHMLIAKKV